MRRYLLPVVAMLLVWGASGPAAEPRARTCVDSAAFALPQRPYVALRRLEAENERSGRQGWLEVKTTFSEGSLVIEFLNEGGSEQIPQQGPARGARERTGAGRQASVGLGLQSTNV